MLRTIFAVLVLSLFAVVIGLPLLLLACFTGTIGPLYPAAEIALRLSLALAGVRVRVEGAENIPAEACLFMANHTSAVDPVAMFIATPRRVAFLAKQELFRIPLLGLTMRLARFLPVDRSSAEAAAGSVDRAVEQLRGGVSMMIYPEGTRSPDGRLLPFKRGGFLLAIRSGRPVVPVVIQGAERILPKHQLWIHPGEIVLKYLPPIAVSGYTDEDRGVLLERVRASIAANLPASSAPPERIPG